MNLRVAGRAVGVLRVLVVLRPGRFRRTDVMGQAMARQAKLIDGAEAQQTRIRRAVWRVASRASFCLYRRMFVSEWTLLVHVTLNASCIRACCQPGLLQFKATVRIMAIAALYGAFKNFVMKRLGEVRFDFAVTAHAKLWLAHLQDSYC